MIAFRLVFFLFFLFACENDNKSIWSRGVGSSVIDIDSMFDSAEKGKKEESTEPLISYNALKSNLPVIDNTSYPLNRIYVGEKVLNELVPKSGIQLEKVLSGTHEQIYQDITSFGQVDIGSLVGSGGGFSMPEPINVQLPLSDLNTDPVVIPQPVPIDKVLPKGVTMEFFFDEIKKKPEFFD